MKKVMTLAVIALLAFSLAGCGGADKKSSTAPSSPPPVKQESAADLFAKGKNLPGITYDVIIELAEQHKQPLVVREISEAELRAADEVWMTSSTKEILAIATLDGKPVGTGKPGPYAEQIWQWYQDFKNTVMRKG